jgi:hypothetical protein
MPELTEKEFWDTYKPLEGPTGQSGSHIWEFEEVKEYPTNQVWTIVETGDDRDENWYAEPGFHIVNRIGYAVTEKPWSEGDDVTGVWFEAFEQEPGRMEAGQIVGTDQCELDRVVVGTLLVDVQGYPFVKNDVHEWAIWAADENRWIVFDDGEVLGNYSGEGVSRFLPATVMEVPAAAAPEDNNWPQTWPVSDEDQAHYADWRAEVADGDTVLGFRAWVANKGER